MLLENVSLADVTAVNLNIDIIVTDASPFETEWAEWASGKVKTWSMTVELNQDFDVGELDDFLFPKLGELLTVATRPKSGDRKQQPAVSGTGYPAVLPAVLQRGRGVGHDPNRASRHRRAGPVDQLEV